VEIVLEVALWRQNAEEIQKRPLTAEVDADKTFRRIEIHDMEGVH
jgi:hypothetical protein